MVSLVDSSMPAAPAAPQTVVFYHRDADGFASALCAWCALGDDGVSYKSVQHREPVPTVEDGAAVFVVDFAYPADVLTGWMDRGCKVTVLDHHQSAQVDLAELVGRTSEAGEGWLDVRFDMDKSGCEIAWEYFWPRFLPRWQGLGPALPWVLRAIGDKDLWRFRHDDTKAICARLEEEQWDFPRWAALCAEPLLAAQFASEGAALLRYQERLAGRQARRWHWYELEPGLRIPVVNCTGLTSETAEAVLHRVRKDTADAGQPVDPDVWGTYAFDPDGLRFSLRSDGRADVSIIAKRHGGGGHKTAASFKVKIALPGVLR